MKKEIPEAIWQNRGIEHLFVNRKKTGHIIKFLESTEVGNRTPEKETGEREEAKDGDWGWQEEERESNDSESDGAGDESAPMESDTELQNAENVIHISITKEARDVRGEGAAEKYG